MDPNFSNSYSQLKSIKEDDCIENGNVANNSVNNDLSSGAFYLGATIDMAFENKAVLKNARKLVRKCNTNAKNFYTLTFLDDEIMNNLHVKEANIQIPQTPADDKSRYNPKFTFDDEDKWFDAVNTLSESGYESKLSLAFDIMNNNYVDVKKSEQS